MDFGLTEEQKILRKSVEDFCKREAPPALLRELEKKGEFPRELRQKMAKLGWYGVLVPEEFGGLSGNAIDVAILNEEMGRGGIGCDFIPTAIFASESIGIFGSDEQKNSILPKIATGDVVFAISFTEPNAGSDFASLTTKAVRDGDEWVISGHKMWTSILNVADYVIIAARTDPEAKKHKGISIFVVDTATEGIRKREIEKLGGHIMPTFEVWYEDIRVPAGALLGIENNGWMQMLQIINTERIGVSALNCGFAHRTLRYAMDYTSKREQFGKPLASFQAVHHKLANVATEIEASRLLTYKAAWLHATGGDPMECGIIASMAKLKAAETYKQAAIDGMQVMGGYGYAMEYDMQRFLREAVLQTVDLGASEIMLSAIAWMLGLPVR